MHTIDLPSISSDANDVCENEITLLEIRKAVKELAINKTPGPDGIPNEFYKIFLEDISDILHKSYSESFTNGMLCESQRQGVIRLIPKKGKNLTDIKSWRPLCLLNSDYKILAKVIANRLKAVLPEIINTDQVGYMANRFCGENTRLIADIIEYSKFTKTPCVILLADFEKAFDTLNWNFLKSCIKHFGFGHNFQKWINVMYCNIQSCVSNNGYQTPYFKLHRGIRQGCPLSALLFLMAAEVVATVLRISDNIKGITVNDISIKLCQLADDMTLFLSNNGSVACALQIFEEFYRYAGLKLNKSKTEAIIVYNDGSLHADKNLGITWIDKPFKTLGIWFTIDSTEMIRLNVSEKINKIKDMLNIWHSRSLTLKGKITVLKSLVVPQILQIAYVLPFSKGVLNELEDICFSFLWSKKKHKIAKRVIIQPLDLGGLKMVSVFAVYNSCKIMWMQRYCNSIESKWKVLSKCLMKIENKMIYQKKIYKNIKEKPVSTFYADLLSVWYNFITTEPKTFEDLLEEPLYDNDLITINDRAISNEYSDWKDLGILKVKDILNENKIMISKSNLEEKLGKQIPDLKYYKISSAIRSKIRNLPSTSLVNNSIPNSCLTNLSKLNNKQVYMHCVKAMYSIPTSQHKWVEYYPFLEMTDWEKIYLLPSKLVSNSFLINLQFKIIHRFFNCNYKLYIWKIKDSSDCKLCSSIDNLEHYFFYCHFVRHFWDQVENWLFSNFEIRLKLTVLEVLLGINTFVKHLYIPINYILLIGKYFIYKCKNNDRELFFNSFLYTMKYLNIEKNISINQGNIEKFDLKYAKLFAIL